MRICEKAWLCTAGTSDLPPSTGTCIHYTPHDGRTASPMWCKGGVCLWLMQMKGYLGVYPTPPKDVVAARRRECSRVCKHIPGTKRYF
jgi:hypothetical protein